MARAKTSPEGRKIQFHLNIDEKVLDAVKRYRFQKEKDSVNEAITELLRLGLGLKDPATETDEQQELARAS